MLLDHAEKMRRIVSPKLAVKRKAALEQFISPLPVVTFMKGVFRPNSIIVSRLSGPALTRTRERLHPHFSRSLHILGG